MSQQAKGPLRQARPATGLALSGRISGMEWPAPSAMSCDREWSAKALGSIRRMFGMATSTSTWLLATKQEAGLMVTFLRPISPSCIECADKRHCHICLLCGQVGCGRQHLGHCLNHFRSEGHPFALEVRRMASACHEHACVRNCDKVVMGVVHSLSGFENAQCSFLLMAR